MTNTQTFDTTFNSLLQGFGCKETSVLAQNTNSIKKLTKLTSPGHAKEFLQNSKE